MAQPPSLTPIAQWEEPAGAMAPDAVIPRLVLARETAIAAAACALALAILVAASLRDELRFPFADAHDWAAEAMRTERSGAWLAYLWRPHGEQRIVWARLAEALNLEIVGHPPAFLIIAAGLWGLGLAAVALLLARGPGGLRARVWLGAAAGLLLLCAPLGEDFAFPVFSVYLYAAGPALAAACLWALSAGKVRSLAFWGALVCAAAAAGGNAAGLAIWPALIGAALIAGAGGAALWVLIAAAAACVVFVEAGLGSPGGSPGAASVGLARLAKMAIYFGSYCGLPWSRALRGPLLGAAAGWPVAVVAALGLARAWRRRGAAAGAPYAGLCRAGAVLALFGLCTAVLATLGRVDELPQPVVPTRYTPFALLLQWGALLLYADRIAAFMAERRRLAVGIAVLSVVLVLAADLRGARLLNKTTDHLRAASRAFDVGAPSDVPMYPRPAIAHAVRRALAARGLPS